MARIARLVVPGYPHHVTQRGSRSQPTFFRTGDYRQYLGLLSDHSARCEMEVWAYCLMPNHVHLVVVPGREDSLARCLADAHRKYALLINRRHGWKGHLWQERFYSCVMDEQHLLAAVRYTELNPVRAGLCKRAEAWPWSSARAHLGLADDELVAVEPMMARIADWTSYLAAGETREGLDSVRGHTKTGRPAGGEDFLKELEFTTGRVLRKKKPGRKRADS